MSVIIPTYNCEKYLHCCVKSLLRQNTQLLYEIIIIDDISTDGTLGILHELSLESKVRVITKSERNGSYSSRNIGAHNANGDILVFTEPDCIAPPNWLENLVDPIIHINNKAVKGPIKSSSSGLWVEVEKTVRHSYYTGLSVKNFAIKKETFQQIGCFDERFIWSDDVAPGDIDLGRRLEKAGINIHYTKKAYIYHHWRNNPFVYFKRRVWHSLERLTLTNKYKPDAFHRMREGNLLLRAIEITWRSIRYCYWILSERPNLTRYIRAAFFFYHSIMYILAWNQMVFLTRKPSIRLKHRKRLLLTQPL